MSRPMVLIQAILAGLQLLVAGSTLTDAGLSHGYAALLVGLVAAAQLALVTYQHGLSKVPPEAAAQLADYQAAEGAQYPDSPAYQALPPVDAVDPGVGGAKP